MILRDYGNCSDPPTATCYGRAMPGTRALRDGVDDCFEELGDLGIYNCRNTASGGPSTHKHGRAWDCACNALDPDQKVIGDLLADILVTLYRAFGIQRIIWFHRIWDPVQGWHAYGCDVAGSPKHHHTDHLHIELCWASARDNPLTVEYVKEAILQVIKDAMKEVISEELAKKEKGAFKNLYLWLTYKAKDGTYRQSGDDIVKKLDADPTGG